ncbi:MAG: hypothetical protein WDO17_11155 [Alphaproteobacteria bacterium]
MDDFDPAELERIRRFGRADWRRFVRPGWERFVRPAGREAQRKEFAKWERAFETPMARRLRKEQEEREQIERERLEAEHRAEIDREALAIKAELASLRVELVWAELRWKAECAERKRRADLRWERFMAAFLRGDFRHKAGFDPSQLRVPAGNSVQSGRWTADPQFTRLAASGKLPPTLGHNSGNFDIPPDRPEDPRERTGAIRAAARFLAKIPGPIGRAAALVAILEGASWLREHQAEIETQLDPPKTLQELQDAVHVDRPGTQIHHIVEQGPAEREGFARSKIDAPDNLVRISKQKHQEISEWFSTKNVRYGLGTPRDWLRGKSWEDRRAVGIEKLIDVGVLKP